MATRNLESKLIAAYASLKVISSPHALSKSAPVERCGDYEVRLLEASLDNDRETFPFWIELFDHKAQASLDSFASHDLEDVARVAAEFISEAMQLSGVVSKPQRYADLLLRSTERH